MTTTPTGFNSTGSTQYVMNDQMRGVMRRALAGSVVMLTRHPAGWQRVTNRLSLYRPREIVEALPSVGGGGRGPQPGDTIQHVMGRAYVEET